MKKINIVIPMAGEGKRFYDNGYSVPKPMIDIFGKPMIQNVIENLNIEYANYIFITQENHFELNTFLKSFKPDSTIIKLKNITDGPASTALFAKDYINSEPLIIINCDQIINDFNIEYLLEFCNKNNADGIVGTFLSNSEKNSYVNIDDTGYITDIKEKIVISNIATNGLHFWKNGLDFINSAIEMINYNEKYNNEFYIAPTYNYMIRDGKKILPFFYNLHWPIGTPGDLNNYKKLYENS